MRKYRGPARGHAYGRKTHCPQGHPYDKENTYIAPGGGRQCKTCRKVRVMESWYRHRDKRMAENEAWREANREQWLANMKAWRLANPERVRLLQKVKKARKRAAGTLTAEEWQLVLDIYGAACLACGTDKDITIDHVVPISRHGLNVVSNVQPLCLLCNMRKGTKTIDYRPVPWDELAA